MYKKILIVEDIDSISLGVKSVIENHVNADIRYTKYCDEACLKIHKAILEEEPFDLLITDLSFKEDHREAKLKSGEELIAAVRDIDTDIPILVYSIEERPYKIKMLFDTFYINAFVNKGRESVPELVEALNSLYVGAKYVSPHLAYIFKKNAFIEIEENDVMLLRSLAEGLTQSQISNLLKSKGASFSSISSIEKRLNKLKIYFKANNTIHLVSVVKEMGII